MRCWKVIDCWQDIKAREWECVWRECRWHRSRHLELLPLLFAGYFWPKCDSESMLYPWQLGPGAKSKQGCTSCTCCMNRTITTTSWRYSKDSKGDSLVSKLFPASSIYPSLRSVAQLSEGTLTEQKWPTWSLQMKRIRILTLSCL